MRRYFLVICALLACAVALQAQQKLVFQDGKWTAVDDPAAKAALDFPLTITLLGSAGGGSSPCTVSVRVNATDSEYYLQELGFHCHMLKTGESLRARIAKPVWGSGRQSVFLAWDENGDGKLKKHEYLVVRVFN